jgi:thiol-disulfide isomerase/thioredoxin
MNVQSKLYVMALMPAFCVCLHAAEDLPTAALDLKRDGAFGFPQSNARVLCDNPELRLSVWNNSEHLFVQTILWKDGDAALGKTEDNREIGDGSTLILDLDGDGKRGAGVDRDYALNPWPAMPGLYYQVVHGDRSSSGLNKDSQGRGAVRYVKVAGDKQVRVDTFLIPMEEISRKTGDKIRLCYYGRSTQPPMTVNSAGYERGGERYYSHHIPAAMHHDYTLTSSATEIDATKVPEGRSDISLSKKKTLPKPKIGEKAPEISAGKWINLEKPVTLEDLRGKVVLVEFWATWCGPCIAAIPHLNELSEKYSGKDFQMLSFVEEGHQTMDRLLRRVSVKYPIGLESSALEAYGITGIPHAFVIDHQGRIAWDGHSAAPEMEAVITAELKKAKEKSD